MFEKTFSDANDHIAAAVDQCHLDLTYGLIRAHKPKSVLELGVGSGRTTATLIKAVHENGDKDKTRITLVDNWEDWKGTKPKHILEEIEGHITVVEKAERDFVFDAHGKSWDFIFSDADHWNTDKWFDYVYDRLLNNNGVLIYHDVSKKEGFPENELRFPNLYNILVKCRERGIAHMHFDRCSTEDERCYRGFLVIFKSQLCKVVPVEMNALHVSS
jgi:predicted O-methyltransferase YrrM